MQAPTQPSPSKQNIDYSVSASGNPCALDVPRLDLLALLQPHYCAGDHQLVSSERTVRIIYVWDDQLCPWHPSLAELQAITTSAQPTLPPPSLLVQLLDTGIGPRRPKWLEADTHNYAHLLQVTVPRHPALLAVTATLPELCAYSATFAPPDALEELTAYLLSWAASAVPFQPLTADQLRRAAASDEGAHRVAELLLQRRLPDETARVALLEGFCSSLTRRARHTNSVKLVSRVFLRLLSTMPLRLLVILLGRLLPLLQSTAVPGVPLVQASGKSASGKPAAASLMHTMARLPPESALACHARSADVCGLREFYVLFSPVISDLCHFHPRRTPPANSKPEGNTRFAPGTLLLFEGTLKFPHLELDGPIPPVTQHDGVTIAEMRSRHGFTYATELIPLPEGPWPVTCNEATAPALRAIDTS